MSVAQKDAPAKSRRRKGGSLVSRPVPAAEWPAWTDRPFRAVAAALTVASAPRGGGR